MPLEKAYALFPPELEAVVPLTLIPLTAASHTSRVCNTVEGSHGICVTRTYGNSRHSRLEAKLMKGALVLPQLSKGGFPECDLQIFAGFFCEMQCLVQRMIAENAFRRIMRCKLRARIIVGNALTLF